MSQNLFQKRKVYEISSVFQDGFIEKLGNFTKSYHQRIGPFVNQNFGKSGNVILVDPNNLPTSVTENSNYQTTNNPWGFNVADYDYDGW